MGGACSAPKRVVAQETFKLLLLGCPAVGKSTVFKQLSIIYRDGFSTEERLSARKHIFAVWLKTFLATRAFAAEEGLGEGGKDLGGDVVLIDFLGTIEEAMRKEAQDGHDSGAASGLDPRATVNALLAAWRSKGMPSAWKHLEAAPDDSPAKQAALRDFPESAHYFHERLFSISDKEEYVPTDDDILRLRRVTAAAATTAFESEIIWPPGSETKLKVPIQCTDVGGQSHHEFDWVKHGTDATAVLFVLCLSDFHQTEANGRNKLKVSLSLLKSIAGSPTFMGKQFIVLFNKSDLLAEKLRQHEVRSYFTSYSGDNSEADVAEYFEERVRFVIESAAMAVPGHAAEVQTTVLHTCAVNSELMKEVLSSVVINLFRSNVRQVWS